MASLDDLFDWDEPARPAAPRRPVIRQLVWAGQAIAAAALLAAGLVAVLLVLGVTVWYPLAVAAILAALVLHRTVTGLGGPRSWPAPPPGREPAADPVRLAPAVGRWQNAGHAGLVELVDERLRQRHGCTRTGDPARARSLLGEPLWGYLSDPAARTPPPRGLAALLTTVEGL
jgi:hypothetical protein